MTVAATTKDKGELTLSFQAFPQDGVLVVGLGNPLINMQFMELDYEQAHRAMSVGKDEFMKLYDMRNGTTGGE